MAVCHSISRSQIDRQHLTNRARNAEFYSPSYHETSYHGYQFTQFKRYEQIRKNMLLKAQLKTPEIGTKRAVINSTSSKNVPSPMITNGIKDSTPRRGSQKRNEIVLYSQDSRKQSSDHKQDSRPSSSKKRILTAEDNRRVFEESEKSRVLSARKGRMLAEGKTKSSVCKNKMIRPHSSYHTRCVDSVLCYKHSQGVHFEPINSTEHAKEKIKEMLRRNKELLVAIMDCSAVVPELFQCRLITQTEVDRIFSSHTKQAQSRTLLAILANQLPRHANKMIEAICRQQTVFSNILTVMGLDVFLKTEERKIYGLEGYKALKSLENCDNVSLKCPICTTKKKKRRSQSATVTQVSKDFTTLDLTDRRSSMRPKSSPMTPEHKTKISEGLALITSVSTEFRDEDNQQWISVLQAEPDIIKIIHRET